MLGFCNQCSQVYSCYVPIRDSFRAPQCEMSAILQYNKVTQRDIDQGNFCQLSFIAVRIPWVNPAQAARAPLFLEWEAGSWKRKCRHLFHLFVQIRNSWACTGCCSLFRANHNIERISFESRYAMYFYLGSMLMSSLSQYSLCFHLILTSTNRICCTAAKGQGALVRQTENVQVLV